MITLTLEASKALCDKLTEMGVKLPETYLGWIATYSHPLGYVCKDCEKFKDSNGDYEPHPCSYYLGMCDDVKVYDIPAPTFSEFINDWLPLLFGPHIMDSQWGTIYDYFDVLLEEGMPAVSTRVIELVKDLPR